MKIWMRGMVVFLVLAMLSAFCAATAGGAERERSFHEELVALGTVPAETRLLGSSLTIDAAAEQVAYVVKGEAGMQVSCGEHLSRSYSGIEKGTPLFAPDDGRCAFLAYAGDQVKLVADGREISSWDGASDLRFSPDGKRYGLRAEQEGKQFLVLDGWRGRSYDALAAGGALFSPDSAHVAYAAQRGREWMMVVDGEEQQVVQELGPPLFSPDSQQLAYAFKQDGQWRVVRGGHPGAPFAYLSGLTFSPDSTRFSYAAMEGKHWLMMVDGRPQASHLGLGAPLFSPDSVHLAYVAQDSEGARLVLDGKVGPAYDAIGVVRFSADSRRCAYMAQRGSEGVMVVDGRVETVAAGIGMPVFSPDSSHLAYRAEIDGAWRVVRDGKPGAAYSALRRPVFSPDSQHLAVAVKQGTEMRMLLDGRPQSLYAAVGRPFFGPGSRHLAYQAKLADGWALVLDGEPGQIRVDGFLKGVPVRFDSPQTFHALALRRDGPEFLRLEINLDPVQNSAEQQQRDAVDAENGSDRQRLAALPGQVVDVEGHQEEGQITEQKDQPGGSR